jgi:hypothetical protein
MLVKIKNQGTFGTSSMNLKASNSTYLSFLALLLFGLVSSASKGGRS